MLFYESWVLPIALITKPPSGPTAILVHQRILYYATGELPGHQPASPVLTLIQGLWEDQKAEGRLPLRLLRERIWTNYAPSLICREAVRVAAKRISVCGSSGKSAGPADDSHWNEIWSGAQDHVRVEEVPVPSTAFSPRSFQSEKDAMTYALGLQTQAEGTSGRKAIACVLLSPSGELLSQGSHLGFGNRALHAEVQALRSYFHRNKRAISLPQGTRVFTTLKPCKMCAAQLWHCSPDRDALEVFYAKNDPGPMAQRTTLDGKGLKPLFL